MVRAEAAIKISGLGVALSPCSLGDYLVENGFTPSQAFVQSERSAGPEVAFISVVVGDQAEGQAVSPG